MSEAKNKLNYLGLTSYIGGGLIFLGFVRLMLYYASFGINIINFLDFSEIITTFLDLAVVIVFVGIGMIIQTIWNNESGEIQGTLKKNYDKLQKLRNIENRILRIIGRLKICLVSFLHCMVPGFLLLIGLVLSGLIHNHHHFLQYIGKLLVYLIIWAIIFISSTFRGHARNSKNIKQLQLLLYGVILFFVVSTLSLAEVNEVRKHKKMNNVSFVLKNDSLVKDTLIISNDNNYYIGNTQKYLFFYHQSNKRTEVIPMDQVENLIFPARNERVYDWIECLF